MLAVRTLRLRGAKSAVATLVAGRRAPHHDDCGAPIDLGAMLSDAPQDSLAPTILSAPAAKRRGWLDTLSPVALMALGALGVVLPLAGLRLLADRRARSEPTPHATPMAMGVRALGVRTPETSTLTPIQPTRTTPAPGVPGVVEAAPVKGGSTPMAIELKPSRQPDPEPLSTSRTALGTQAPLPDAGAPPRDAAMTFHDDPYAEPDASISAPQVDLAPEAPPPQTPTLAQAMARAVDHGVGAQVLEREASAKELPPFDRGAALAALGRASRGALACRGVRGRAAVQVTLAPSGAVSRVSVGAPFAGTSVEGCITARFQAVHVPAFVGAPVVVNQTLTFE